LTGVEQRSDGILRTFANGARIEAEFVIGTDGIRSVVRHALYGDDSRHFAAFDQPYKL
jgi:salicylate hydroxylase